MTLQELDDCEELSDLRNDLKSARRCCASMRREIRRLKHEQPNNPLTVDELPCFEPIYVVPLGSSVGEWSAHWCIYQIDNATAESDTHKGRKWFLYDTDYSKTWLAYRRPLEAGEQK